jgi:two-component system cell cycle response regulator
VIPKKFDELRLTGSLPSPSFVGLSVLKITETDDYLLETLTRAIMADPALSGRIIKLANSADREGVGNVTSVPQAAMRLGPSTVRMVALGFTLVTDNSAGECQAFNAEGHWSRSLATAVAAHTIASHKKICDSSEAFTCALLCDVGKLALGTVHPEVYSKVLEANPRATDRELAELEKRAFDITHYEVSAAMMDDWGLPPFFQEAVLTHEFETADASDSVDPLGEIWAMVTILRASKAVGRLISAEPDLLDEGWRERFDSLGSVAHSLGLEPDEFYGLCDSIVESWSEWGQALGITTLQPPPFADLAQELRGVVERPDGADGRPEDSDSKEATDAERELAERVVSSVLDGVSNSVSDKRSTRILLIDDDHRMLRLLRHHLVKEGYDVSVADSSREGLEKALRTAPQIVISDWMMPGMSGVKLCATLRKTQAGRKMYILIVTARDDDEQVVEAFAAGADDYIVKPFNARILLARVRAGQRMIQMREKVEDSEKERLRQVAEMGILTRRLREAAMTDALTELPNRRYAMDHLKQDWDNAQRSGAELSVLMIDIDHFKLVNDECGHDVGDTVLREVAQILRSQSRSGDVLCRLGGEEFLSININCGLERALVCAERLRAAIERATFVHGDVRRKVTVSVGVAHCTADMDGVDDMLKEADEGLYVAKETGRNMVVSNYEWAPDSVAPDSSGTSELSR